VVSYGNGALLQLRGLIGTERGEFRRHVSEATG
jgi:hypothetical protein